MERGGLLGIVPTVLARICAKVGLDRLLDLGDDIYYLKF
jgi:hypothetical protein